MLIISYNVRILRKYSKSNGYNSPKIEERAKYPYNGTYQVLNLALVDGSTFPD
jgi:hypothetical protein